MKRTLVAAFTVLSAAAFPAASSAAPYSWLKFNTASHKPLIMSHQGGEDENPSNTMYAFKKSIRDGATSLELDIGVTKDDKVIVMHDTTVDRVTNGTGNVSDLTLAQIKALDGAYWFSKTGSHYDHGKAASAYTFRGIATGAKRPPTGFKRTDFRITTLSEVLAAFPHTAINIEIKGRTPAEVSSEYDYNAVVLANLLKNSPRTDLVVVSFKQHAVDVFTAAAPNIPTAPGIEGDYGYLFASFADRKLPSSQTVAFQVPNSFNVPMGGGNYFWAYNIANCGWIRRAHNDGYAWHQWFGSPAGEHPGDVDGIGNGSTDGGWKYLLDRRVDGIMTARPKALAAYMKTYKWNKSTNVCQFVGGGGY
jgi:glycerophosphoryl diester phosphodiesterase